MRLHVKAEPGAATALNKLSATGGGAPPAAISRPLTVGDPASVPFGLERFSLTPEEEGGATATHAGSHPYQLTTDTTFNRSNTETLNPPALPRNLEFQLPPGQLGNATIAPKCADGAFGASGPGGNVNLCPSNTAIGATIVTASTFPGREETFAVPVFNLQPAVGEPARFGFTVLRNPVILDTSVRSSGKPGTRAGDYGITVAVHNTTQLVNLISATTVFWGAPGSPTHNESRGWGCIRGGFYVKEFEEQGGGKLPCEPSSSAKPPAFLTLPTDCASPFNPLFGGVSWPTTAAPGGFIAAPLESRLADEAGDPLSLVACNQVPFDPRTGAEPTSNAATSPTGLNFDITFLDEGLLNDEGVAQSQLKKAIVTLPEGFSTNPSVAEGLHACPQAA
jgi:hypothetical protein